MKQKEGREEWLSGYAEWKASGLSQKAYCKRIEMGYDQFNSRLQTLRREGLVPRERVVAKEASSNSRNFVALAVRDERKDCGVYCELRFHGGTTVQVESKAAWRALKELFT